MDERDKPSLADQAYRQIEQMIVERALPPGSLISEKQLCDELGCGRTPIREALQRLRIEGYIVIMPSRGVLVAPVDIIAQLELLEMRRPLESLLVQLGADRADAGQRARLRATADDLCRAAAAEDSSSFFQNNRLIQQMLCDAGHNGQLSRTMLVVYGQSRRFWFTALDDPALMGQAAAQYRTTAMAVVDGRGDDAVASVGAFLDLLETLTRAAIDRRRHG